MTDVDELVLNKLLYWYRLAMRMGDAITAIVRGGYVSDKELDELSAIYLKHVEGRDDGQKPDDEGGAT